MASFGCQTDTVGGVADIAIARNPRKRSGGGGLDHEDVTAADAGESVQTGNDAKIDRVLENAATQALFAASVAIAGPESVVGRAGV